VIRPACRRLFLTVVALVGSATAVQAAAAYTSPTVVELFTSQGCSSCPPANDKHAALGDRPDVLALSFGITYWDQLGWKALRPPGVHPTGSTPTPAPWATPLLSRPE
jgi:hypothetical protein